MAKQCKNTSCNKPAFSDGYCAAHHPKCKYQQCNKFAKTSDGYCKEHQKIQDFENGVLLVKEYASFEGSVTALAKHMHSPTKKKRSAPISKLSKKKQSNKAIIASIKKEEIEKFGNKCFLHPNKEAVDAFHIYPVGKYPEYETEHWNIVPSCRFCNHTWDQGTWEQIKLLSNIHWILWVIWAKDNDPNKLHTGSFYEQLMNRKHK